MGPNLVPYLLGAGVVGTWAGAGDAAGAAAIGRDWLTANRAAVGAATGGLVVGSAAPAGGEEGRCTQGLKLCPPQVRAMFRCLEKNGNGEFGRISSSSGKLYYLVSINGH